MFDLSRLDVGDRDFDVGNSGTARVRYRSNDGRLLPERAQTGCQEKYKKNHAMPHAAFLGVRSPQH
jgi:hypothetical protein